MHDPHSQKPPDSFLFSGRVGSIPPFGGAAKAKAAAFSGRLRRMKTDTSDRRRCFFGT